MTNKDRLSSLDGNEIKTILPTLDFQEIIQDGQPYQALRLLGCWSIEGNIGKQKSLINRINILSRDKDRFVWDLSDITSLDSAGAMYLWLAWQQKQPKHIILNDSEEASFRRLSNIQPRKNSPKEFDWLAPVEHIGRKSISIFHGFLDMVALIGSIGIHFIRAIRSPKVIPWLEISANIYRAGFLALFICAMVGYTIGIAISYLLSLQLLTFGADDFIVPILGIGITRELGPLLGAILIAGRSGSSMTAQIGVMRITGEIDALNVMGISSVLRLVFPKVLALTISTPFIVFWTSIAGILGGLLASKMVLGIGISDFLVSLPKELIVTNLWIALGKGATFGFLIGVIASYFGLKVKPNTESLSKETTASVVTSITVVILVNALYAILLSSVGI